MSSGSGGIIYRIFFPYSFFYFIYIYIYIYYFVYSLYSGGEAIYFCLSTGLLMSLYQDDPESIHDGYRKFMTRVVGVN